MKNGRKNKERGSIFSIKSSMIVRKKWDSTWMKDKMKNGKSRWISKKYKEDWENMKQNRRGKDNSNGSEDRLNSKNFWNKSLPNNKEEEWFYRNYIERNNKWKQQDKITIDKFKTERPMVDKTLKTSRKHIVYSDQSYHYWNIIQGLLSPKIED